MNALRPAVFALSLHMAIAGAVAQSASNSRAARAPGIDDVAELAGLRERWTGALETLGVPGFAVAIVKDGRVLALEGFGVRNVKGDPVTPDTSFYIASATKPYTAMGVCILAAEGKLDLDAPVKRYLPQMQLPDAALTDTLTVRDLLCHRHGLNSGAIVHRDAYTGQITDEIYFRLLREAEIARQVRYTNVHFTLAGRVIEAVGGKKWQDFLDQRLFEPAGMPQTTAYASEMYGAADHAEPLLLIDGRWERSPLLKTDRTMHAAGGMGTTARDAARWLMLNINGGEIDGTRILPEELGREYLTKQSDHPQPRGSIRIEDGFALGWNVGKYREQSRPYYFHGGGYVGAASYICFVPNERIGVAVLANSDGGQAIATIVSIDVLDRLLGVTGAQDLLPVYEEEAKRRRDNAPKRPTGENPAKAAGALSQPAQRYAGTYSHPELGELEFGVSGTGELAARIGDLPLTLLTRGPDRFIGCVVPGMTLEGAFEIDAEGRPSAVVFDWDGESQRFQRTGGG